MVGAVLAGILAALATWFCCRRAAARRKAADAAAQERADKEEGLLQGGGGGMDRDPSRGGSLGKVCGDLAPGHACQLLVSLRQPLCILRV